MSSSQLIFIFFRGVGIPPTSSKGWESSIHGFAQASSELGSTSIQVIRWAVLGVLKISSSMV
jgi:hypothetical protein